MEALVANAQRFAINQFLAHVHTFHQPDDESIPADLQGERATSLASQLLTFGKGGAPVRRPTPLAAVVRDAVDLGRAGATSSIELLIGYDLWSADVDVEQISHALHNILLNARQAMPEGGTIEVRAENVVLDANSLPLSGGRYVMISIADHGYGIGSELLPTIFDPYFTTKPNDRGLGLASVNAIVAKHEGHITVRSTLGVGTTFSVYLPACTAVKVTETLIGAPLQTGTGRILVRTTKNRSANCWGESWNSWVTK